MEAMRAMHGTSEDKPATEGGQKAAAEDSAGEKKPDEESGATAAGKKKETAQSLGRMWASEGDVMEEHERNNEEENALEMLQEAMRKKELAPVDHTLVDYIPIRKNMYILPKALAHLLKPENAKELNAKREDLEIKIRGRGCPPPVDTWAHCGISDRVLAQLTRVYGPDSAPFAVQKQAIPAIMSGRDIIGIAKTGSGKTLAFLLPMFRHILDQPVLGEGEGPIGLILAPARELAVQIYNEAKKFTKSLGLRVTAIYGGAGVAEQIGEMKRGSDIVVCTPGRMIDILTMQAGKLVSLRRVSFVVMDEADRMFDMGFEPQIRMILQNVRPDRQTCLFSATFPDKVQNLAKKSLKAPVEIVVGGRSVANAAITQHAEVRDEDDKFMRLLQLLGVWFERGHVLVFVDTQQRCDRIFEDLMRSGYPCLSLHGGKDQHDRDQTIADFKNKVCTLMVATSVAGRGLDVPDLVCVVNYSCPNHIEDYVHRVGRTGRAGKKGTAYTFISKDEEQYAPLLVKALTQAKQEIPTPLQEMADAFRKKIDAGDARWASSGFGGSGFTFDNSEKNEVQRLADMQRRQYEIENGLRDPANLFSDEEGDIDSEDEREAKAATEAASAAASSAVGQGSTAIVMPGAPGDTPLERAKRLATQLAAGGGSMVVPHNPMASGSTAVANALAQAKLFAQRLSQNQGATTGTSMNLETGTSAIIGQETAHHEDDLVINDYPQKARWKITHRETIDDVSEKFSVAIISRGGYIPPGKKPKEGERKLYLAIEGHSELAVSGARRELVRILNEETMRVGLDPRASYSVV
uniref:RNA helicase n=2 Tax=Octactis speculum TaxID=3111310 RepID=A0A7S2MDB2_9STRA|mmetsp:Transcript_59925/g.81994  ORF Transcript_59925/g.81994 Transcript_59925/m.81994 type:complete len:805 (+) Transcript_59925:74-2488(+)